MSRACRVATIPALVVAVACGGGGSSADPVPATGFGVLSGKTTLVLPVQYVRKVPGGWVGGSSNAREAARAADAEIAFALEEYGGRATWILPDQQVAMLRRQPSIRGVDPYLLSADELRRERGGTLKNYRDPLFGEVRKIAALFEARYAIWPMELFYLEDGDSDGGRLAIHAFLLDVRAGGVLWYGVVPGGDEAPASPAALASVAQAFAVLVSP